MQEITLDNVFNSIEQHQHCEDKYSKELQNEIEFISSHLYEIIDNRKESLLNVIPHTMMKILQNENLKIKDEDQLLTLINFLYQDNRSYSILYDNVYFKRASTEKIEEFVLNFDKEDLSETTWRNLCQRLMCQIKE